MVQLLFPYPAFLLCIPHCTNAFWRSIFHDLAHGKAPMGAVFNHKEPQRLRFMAVCNSQSPGDGADDMDLTSDRYTTNSKELYNAVVRGLVVAGRDAQPAYERLRCNRVNATPWSDLKRKGIKYQFLELFVLDEMARVKFSMEVASRAIVALQSAINSKKILPGDIHFDGFGVRSIDGVRFTNATFTIL